MIKKMVSFKIMTSGNTIGVVKDFAHITRSEVAQYIAELESAKQELVKLFDTLT